MLDRAALELTMLEIARQSGEVLDSHARYSIRNGVAQVLQAKERHRRGMVVLAYQWKKTKYAR